MTTKKRTYPAEFKQEAVRLWETSGKSAMEIERELGITHGLLNKWKRQLKNEGQAAFPGRGHLAACQQQEHQEELKPFHTRFLYKMECLAILGNGRPFIHNAFPIMSVQHPTDTLTPGASMAFSPPFPNPFIIFSQATHIL